MKRPVLILLTLAAIAPALSAQPDTLSRYAPLDSLLADFFLTLEPEENDVKAREYDALISTCRDSLTRQHVALQIYGHYSNSRLMGEEAVAIHVYDEWFASGKVKPRSEYEEMDMWRFVSFNRNTLLGMKAPEVDLYKPCGKKVTVPAGGKISTLFFYDTSCAKCRLEVQLLPSILDKVDFPMDFYAVYVGTDRASWRKFRKSFRCHCGNVRFLHFWDPEMESDYGRLYGVLGTPRMYVALEDGEIVGRRLEVDNLQQIIDYISLLYGKESKKEQQD